MKIYHDDVLILQPRRQLGAVGQHLEQRGSEGTVVVPPDSSYAGKALGHLLITLHQHTGTVEETS